MTELASYRSESPFDQIKHIDENGLEYWLARELQILLGYETWQRFQDAVERARTSMINTGQDPDVNAAKVVDLDGGYERGDYKLSRFGAYMVAMNGDPRKTEIANAQSYFAIKTREAELGFKEIPKDYPAALRAYAGALEEAIEAKKKVTELEPKAEEYDAYMDSDGNLSWTALAKALYRDDTPKGRNKLIKILREQKIITPVYMSARAEPYQKYLDKGWFKVIVSPKHYKEQTFTLPYGHSEIYKLLKDLGEDVTNPDKELDA